MALMKLRINLSNVTRQQYFQMAADWLLGKLRKEAQEEKEEVDPDWERITELVGTWGDEPVWAEITDLTHENDPVPQSVVLGVQNPPVDPDDPDEVPTYRDRLVKEMTNYHERTIQTQPRTFFILTAPAWPVTPIALGRTSLPSASIEYFAGQPWITMQGSSIPEPDETP